MPDLVTFQASAHVQSLDGKLRGLAQVALSSDNNQSDRTNRRLSKHKTHLVQAGEVKNRNRGATGIGPGFLY